MIVFLEGVLEEKQPTRVVLNIAGVGHEVFIPLSSYDRLPATGQPCRILTHDCVREDAHILYGFMTEEERRMFLLLLGITGIGPKIALSALSGLSTRELVTAVVEGDVKRISSISGIGKKMAERMVVELRHKLGEGDVLEAMAGSSPGKMEDTRLRDVILALVSLGYKQVDAQKMAQRVSENANPEEDVETLLKKALTG